MITIPVVNIGTEAEPLLAPAQPFPADTIAIGCDGQHYMVYQSGDDVPEQD